MRQQYTLQPRWLALLALGFLGTGAELLLLDHVEGIWQKIPVALIALGLLALVLCTISRRPAFVRFFQSMMMLVLASGLVGVWLHFQGNMEFELEMHPEERGWPLIWSTLKGATPALSPGIMIFLGLLGLFAVQRSQSAAAPIAATTNTNQTT